MTPPAILYLAGMLLVLLGERIIGSSDPIRYVLSGGGGVMVLASLGWMFQRQSADNAAHATRLQIIFGAVGAASLLVYALSLDWFIDALSLSEDGEYRVVTVLQSLWPILWLSGIMPMYALDRALVTSPIHLIPDNSRELALGWLSAAFALAMLFPLNYIAADMSERWDLGYFKTAQPGAATLNLVGNLQVPVTAYLFFPSNSSVTPEIRGYFNQLPEGNLAIELVDHALEYELSKSLKVRDNGYVVLVRGEGDDRQIERIKIGKDFDSSRRNLKKLDNKVYEGLLQVAREARTVYFTSGHGEMYWRASLPIDRRLNEMKTLFRQRNFNVKELSIANGLATEIPEDAAVVMIFSPTEEFIEEEVAVLNAYRRQGGKLWIALDPGTADFSPLLDPLGVKFDGSVFLATDQQFLSLSKRPQDRLNLLTNKFTTHESVTTLSRNTRRFGIATPHSGIMSKVAPTEAGVKNSITIRTLEATWNDVNRNLRFDESDGETRQAWPLAMVASGAASGGEGEFRAIVTADATWGSDLMIAGIQGNGEMLKDGLAWLLEDPATGGEVNNEEDVKFQHTKENEGWIFYSTSLLLPLGFLVGGLARVRLRKKRG